jgi:hypothetical protein
MKTTMWSLRLLLAALLLIASAMEESEAAPITFTESTVGSGSLGGVQYANALVTFNATADTSQVVGPAPFFTVHPTTLTVTVAGLGSGTFTSSRTDVFDNQTFVNGSITGIAGIGDLNLGATALGTSNTGFQTYALMSSIGPLSGPNFIRPDITFTTTAGAFALTSAGTATFQANTGSVPEPSSLCLCGIAGAIGVIISRARGYWCQFNFLN